MSIKTVTILVSRVGNSHKLQLSDDESNHGIDDKMESQANKGDHIVWKLKKDSGIDKFHGIKFPLLENKLHPAQGDGEEIHATITTANNETDTYEIGYYADGKPEVIWEDPKLKLNF